MGLWEQLGVIPHYWSCGFKTHVLNINHQLIYHKLVGYGSDYSVMGFLMLQYPSLILLFSGNFTERWYDAPVETARQQDTITVENKSPHFENSFWCSPYQRELICLSLTPTIFTGLILEWSEIVLHLGWTCLTGLKSETTGFIGECSYISLEAPSLPALHTGA